MSKRVVLIEPEYARYPFSYIPQGLLSIATKLEEAGFDVSVHSSPPLPECDVLGISASTPQYTRALRIALGSVADKIVLGGAHATTSTAEALRARALDAVVVGDGERALLDICKGVHFRKIPGVAYWDRDRDMVMAVPGKPFQYNKRSSPLSVPNYDLWQGELGKCVNVYKNREYEWDCAWERSNRPKWWFVLSKEISKLLGLGVRSVVVTDEEFGLGYTGLKKTIGELDRLDSWSCRSSVRGVLLGKLATVLAGSKCAEIEIDVVAGSERILSGFANHTIKEADLAIRLMEEIGVGVALKATLGLPGETKNSMMKTWKWLEGRKVRLETLSPYPGTLFYEKPEEFSRFGFEVTAVDVCSFDADNGNYPWRMKTIGWPEFDQARSMMVEGLAR